MKFHASIVLALFLLTACGGGSSNNQPTNVLVDSDGDGVGDNADAFPNDATETIDTDADGVGDNADAFPNDPTETIDTDIDGVGDNADVFPDDATETIDTDIDGVGDNADVFPNDATETIDTDIDGVGDNADAFPNDATETIDTDADGVGDNADAFPNDATETIDSDSDGIGDNADEFPSTPFNDNAMTVCTRTADVATLDYNCEAKNFVEYGLGTITEFQVTEPEILLFDRTVRKEELLTYANDTVEAICTSGVNIDYDENITPVATNYERDLQQSIVLDWRRYFAEATADWFANDDQAAADFMVRNLLSWANAESMSAVDLSQGGSSYDLKRWSIVTIQAWDSLSSYELITDSQASIIEDYLEKVISRMDYYDYLLIDSTDPSGLDIYNHGWFRDVVNMLWGVKTNNDDLFQLGIKRYLRILDAHLREDGSIIAESQRGSEALHYNGNSLGHAIQIAEIASQQGYDLYNVKVNGIDIHQAVNFMISAIEDHSLITQYSEYQLTCTEEQCSNWAVQNFNERSGWNDVAWVEIYIRRFPESEITARLREYFELPEFDSVYHDTVGAITSCDYRVY